MYQRILVPVDGSTTSGQSLAAALRLAKETGGQVRLVHVVEELVYLTGYDPYGGSTGELIKVMHEAGDKVLGQGMALAKEAGVEAQFMLFGELGHRLAETVADAARRWNADLIVVGTHGRRGVSRMLLGSGAEQIIRLAPVPVLVIRSEVEPAANPA